jgi:2-dehydro-3-deoxy-D-arabinonate dehydratase
VLVLDGGDVRYLGRQGRLLSPLLTRRVRFRSPTGIHEGVVTEGAGRLCVSETQGDLSIAVLDPDTLALPEPYTLLMPVEPPEVWCAGVTYERSRDARIEESGSDVYARVYDADRPELFLKDAQCRRTVGPGQPVAIRSDSAWNVPEPEIGLVLGDDLEIVGYTIGNDVSSRDIEGANPLYIPQAKVFAGACALGPAVYVPDDWDAPLELRMRIEDADGAELFSGTVSTAAMKRGFSELVSWLVRDNPVPPGSVLLTGTGLVPPDDFTLLPGHVVEIHVAEIGTLRNPVVRAADLLPR